MPAKTVTCAVCNQTINKAQTVHIGDGKRACKTHDVKEQAEQAQASIKKEHTAWVAKAAEKKKTARNWSEPPILKPKCFHCDKIGMRQQEFFLELLVRGEIYEKINNMPLHPFDAEECKKAYAGMDPCLWYIPYPQNTIRLRFNQHQAASLVGYCMLCNECCEKCGVKPNQPTNMDEISKMSALYETFVRPEVKKIANDRMVQ